MSNSNKHELKNVEIGVPGDKVKVPRIGLGCMGLTPTYGSVNEQEALRTLRHAIDRGCTFWDTADIYGLGFNEKFISKVLKENRDKVFICTKFGHDFIEPTSIDPNEAFQKYIKGINGKPEYIRKAVEGSLRRLGIDTIDLYYQHRVDSDTPIEETVKAMAELVKEGKVRYLGLSECSAETLRRAHKVHPIAAVQYEYNCWSLDVETSGIAETCRELGVTLVAYSPLGRGFMTGQIRKFDDLEPGDVRRSHPRFQPENFETNLVLVDALSEMANKKGCKPGQLALAWVLAQGSNVIAIPGTKRVKYLDENIDADNIELNKQELEEIRKIIGSIDIAGQRYPERLMEKLNK